MKKETIQIRIERPTHKRLKHEVFEIGTTITNLATEIINQYLDGNTEYYAINRSEIQTVSKNLPTIR